MFRIAFMLALHNNPEQANVFIRQCLLYKGSEVFIHIDRKGIGITDKLIKDQRVHILLEHLDARWGDVSQVKYVLALMRYIASYERDTLKERFNYISIHSGSDMFVRPISELVSFLEKDNRFAYLDCRELPWKEWQYGGGLGRIALYWPVWLRTRLKRYSFTHICRAFYGRLYGWGLIKGRKMPTGIRFYGKSAWYTISGECMHRCLKYIDHKPAYLKIFEHALCPDEIFFDTLVNLVGKDKVIDEQKNLRYDDMGIYGQKDSGSPKTITMDDVERIKNSGAYFARKFDISIDQAVVDYYLKRTSYML